MASKLLSLDEAAARLGIESDELLQLIAERKVFGIKDGPTWKFKEEDIDRYQKSMGADSSGDEAFFLPVDDGAGQNEEIRDDDLGLVTDELLGGAGGPSSSTIIGQISGDDTGSTDSDLKLGGSDSDLQLSGDSGVSLVPEDNLDSGSGGSGLKLVPTEDSGSSSDLQLVDLDNPSSGLATRSDSSTVPGDSDATVEGKLGSGLPGSSDLTVSESDLAASAGSDLSISESDLSAGLGSDLSVPGSGLGAGSGGSDLAISESGLSLGDDDDLAASLSASKGMGSSSLTLPDDEFDDDDIVLGGSSGLGSGIGDSGINLEAANDSGLSLEEPLELGGDDGLSDDSDEIDMDSDDDFLLTPMLELDDQDSDSSGSQVIALDTDDNFDDQAATLLGEDVPGMETLGADAMAEGAAQPLGMEQPMLVPMSAPAAKYSGLVVAQLVLCFLLMGLTGMMMFEMIGDIWSWDGPSNTSTAIMDAVLDMLPD